MPSPRHMEPHPSEPGYVWDVNFGKYIPDPNQGGARNSSELSTWFAANPDIASAQRNWGQTADEQQATSSRLASIAGLSPPPAAGPSIPLVPPGGQAMSSASGFSDQLENAGYGAAPQPEPVVQRPASYQAPPPMTGTLEPRAPIVARPQITIHDGGNAGPPEPMTGTLEPMTRLVTSDGRVVGIPRNDPQFQQAIQAGGQILQPGTLSVRMPDGSVRSFNEVTTELDMALRSGGVPIDPLSGEDMPARQPLGDGQGWAFGPDDLPANVVLGQGWQPGQLDKMIDLRTEGTLMAGYPKTFAWDAGKIADDPGYQFALEEGEKGVNRRAGANLSLLSGKTLKDLERFRTGLASTYSDTYYDRASKDFERDYNIFENTQNKRFNRLAALSGIGQTAVDQLNTAGSNYGGNAGNVIMNTGAQNADLTASAGNARASQFVGQGNIWGNYDPGNRLMDLAMLRRL